jgi:hypothetical protein
LCCRRAHTLATVTEQVYKVAAGPAKSATEMEAKCHGDGGSFAAPQVWTVRRVLTMAPKPASRRAITAVQTEHTLVQEWLVLLASGGSALIAEACTSMLHGADSGVCACSSSTLDGEDDRDVLAGSTRL